MRKRMSAIIAAMVFTIGISGCGGVSAADRPYVRQDNAVIPFQFRGGVFGALTLACDLYGYACEKTVFTVIMNESERFMRELDAEITTQRAYQYDADGNPVKDSDGKFVYAPDNEQSYVWRFNANVGGEPYALGSETWTRYPLGEHGYDMLSRAASLNAATDGYFDPTVYSLMKLWGLETGSWNSAAAHKRLPAPEEVAQTLTRVGTEHIRVGEDKRGYYICKRDPNIEIDLGAQAKGYAADRLKNIIAAHPEIISAMVNIAGNLYFIGTGYPDVVTYRRAYYLKGYRDYTAAVTDPYTYNALLGSELQSPILGLNCRDTSVVTSGDYVRRFYWFDGYSYSPPVDQETEYAYFCHIIDPKTGYPCNINPGTYNPALDVPYSNKSNPSGKDAREQYKDELTSVTVVHASSELADVYATAIMLMGRTKGLAWMEANDIDAFLLGCDGYYALRYGGGTETGKGFTWANWTAKGLLPASGYGITEDRTA